MGQPPVRAVMDPQHRFRPQLTSLERSPCAQDVGRAHFRHGGGWAFTLAAGRGSLCSRWLL